ncbi:MAG TPA: hypothetical protein PKN64_03815 [Casimicrobium sp.]|nr:hypothetical protein [Casimicrobium sp.]
MKKSKLTASERRERAQLAFERLNPGLPWPAHSAAVRMAVQHLRATSRPGRYWPKRFHYAPARMNFGLVVSNLDRVVLVDLQTHVHVISSGWFAL